MNILKINGTIPFTEVPFDLTLNGKDLIITGKNGCGKTQLLDSIYEVISRTRLFKRKYFEKVNNLVSQLETDQERVRNTYKDRCTSVQDRITQCEVDIEIFNGRLISRPEHSNVWSKGIKSRQGEINNLNESITTDKLDVKIEGIRENVKVDLNNYEKKLRDELFVTKGFNSEKEIISTKVVLGNLKDGLIDENNLGIISFFSADRKSNFQSVNNIRSLEEERNQIKVQGKDGKAPNSGSLIERFLANWEVKSALSQQKGDYTVVKELTDWKIQFVKSLKVLLDDESTDIEFNVSTLNYEIIQKGKERFSFRDLSSGYSSILKVFSDLLMQTEVSIYSPNSISGYVIIDEIDVHLHISLQRKVLPFLSSLFPKVQFIVSTHSPFVLMSVDNAVIFDLEKNEQIDEDLSSYSYSAVLEGILGIKPTSLLVEKTFSDLSEIMNSNNVDRNKLEQLINEIKPISDKLNNREKSFYLQGVDVLSDMDSE